MSRLALCIVFTTNESPEAVRAGVFVHVNSQNELRRGRVRSYNKILRKNKEYTVLVLRVHMNDKGGVETGFPDLSLKAVPRDQLPIARDKWEKSKTVHGILRHVAKRTGKDTIELYEQFGWPMADEHGHTFIGIRKIMNDEKLNKLSDEERKQIIMEDLEKAGAPKDTLDVFYSEL